jgi:hypothetical protein
MSRNPYQALVRLLPQRPLQVGTVQGIIGGVATISLPGGGTIHARASAATVGQRVFVRDGVVEGEAPDLPVELITV